MGLYSDVTLSDSQYIPQYAGLPLDTARSVGDTLAERHYQNLARMDQLALLAQQQKTQVLPGDRWYVDSQVDQIREALGDIAKNGGENATARVAAIANRYMGDENILTSLQRAGDVQKEMDVEAQLRAAGKTPVRQAGARERLQAGIIGRETGAIADDAYKMPYQSTAEAFVAPVPEMEQIWDAVNPDAWYTNLSADEKTKISKLIGDGKISPDMDMPLFFKTVRGTGISTDKIEQMLGNAFSSYKNQPSYRQQTGLLGKNDTELKSEMMKQGLLRVFSKADPQYYQNSVADDMMRAALKKPGTIPYEYVPGMTVENVFGYSPDKMFSEPSILDEATAYTPHTVGPMGAQVGSSTKLPTGPSEQQKASFHADVKTASEVFGIPIGQDPSKWTAQEKTQAVDLAKQYQQLVEKRVSTPYRTNYDNDQSRELSGQMKRSISSRVVYDMNEGEKLSVVDNKGRLKSEFAEIVTDPEKFVLAGQVDPKDPYVLKAGPEFAQAYYGQIWDAKNGQYKDVLITPPAQELESATGNIARNTAIIYNSVNLKPGSWQEVAPSLYRAGKSIELPKVKARELIGQQRSAIVAGLSPQEQTAVNAVEMLIEAEIDGQTMYFSSPEHLSQHILNKSK